MKKNTRAIGTLLLILLALIMLNLLPAPAAKAAGAEDTGEIGFYVQAVLPDNQMDKTLTYFDLRMAPGQSQTLEVAVVNETEQPIVVDISAISASTNRNGVIDYKTPGIRDITLQHPFSQLAGVEDSALTVPARGSATARVSITMPRQPYNGVVLGGLVFTRRQAAPPESTGGTKLQNLYSYVIGVKLSENDTPVKPDFELVGVEGEVVNYQPALVHGIRNRNAAIAKGIDLHVVLRNAEGQVVGEATRTGIDMAPNSTMPLAVTPVLPGGAGSQAAQNTGSAELLPGDYTSELTLTHGGQSWSFEQAFTIGSVQAQSINDQAIGSATQTGGQSLSGTLVVILLSAAAVIIVGLFIIILLMLRRREEAKELNRLRKQRGEHLRMQRDQGHGAT